MGLLSACGAVEAEPCATASDFAATTASEVVYVSAACSGGDGSLAHPYSTLSAAIAAARPGATVLAAKGTYAEHLTIDKSLRIVGPSDAAMERGIILQVPAPPSAAIILKVPRPDDLGIILKAPKPEAAVHITSGEVVLEGLAVQSSQVSGVQVSGGKVTLRRVRIDGTRADAQGKFGDAVLATGGATITLENVAAVGAARYGVAAVGAEVIAAGCLISGNGAGGMRVEDNPLGTSALTATELRDNRVAGVAAFSSRGIILQYNAIVGTTAAAGDALGLADGLVVGALSGSPASVGDVRLGVGNEVRGNARVGVLVAAGGRSALTDARIEGNALGGVWLQDVAGTTTRLERLTVVDNGLMGVAVTLGAKAELTDCTISKTRLVNAFQGASLVSVGDGVGVLAGASVALKGGTVSGNGRAGVLFDGAAGGGASTVTGAVVRENRVGIILQHPRPEGAATVSADAKVSANVEKDVDVVAEESKAYGVSDAAKKGLAATAP